MKSIYYLSFLLLGLATSLAQAKIAYVTGNVVQEYPAMSVESGVWESDTEIRCYNEQQLVTLCHDVSVDLTEPNYYHSVSSFTPGVIPAGTLVNSHFVHFDKVGTSGAAHAVGRIYFDGEILGVIVEDVNLDSTDSLGIESISYPAGLTYRGAIAGPTSDVVGVHPTFIDLDLDVTSVIDQIRVLTLPATACRDHLQVKFQQLPLNHTEVQDIYWYGHSERSTAYAVDGDPNTGTPATRYQGRFMADDFGDLADTPVVAVKWWGSYRNNERYGGIQRFLIAFESDHPTLPFPGGAVTSEIVTLSPSSSAAIGEFTETYVSSGADPCCACIDLYRYHAVLAKPFFQDPNTVYWLKIVALVDEQEPPRPAWGWHIRDYTIEDLCAAHAPDIVPGEHIQGYVFDYLDPAGMLVYQPVFHFQNAAVSGTLNLRFNPDVPGCRGVHQRQHQSEMYWCECDGPSSMCEWKMDLAFKLITCPDSAGGFPGDINGDGAVDINDLVLVADGWLGQNCGGPDWCGGADVTGDGSVDLSDLAQLLPFQSPDDSDSEPPVLGVPDLSALGYVNDAIFDEEPETQVYAVSDSRITIKGRLFYNDLRTTGHFNWRLDRSGNRGTQMGYSSTSNNTNYLAALDVVADFYELDSYNGVFSCDSQEYLGSATVNYAGDYSITMDYFSDDCPLDGDSIPDIGVRFRLRFCNNQRCFSVEKDNQNNYRLWHRHANPNNPLTATRGTHELADGCFQAAYGDDYSKAASVYASLVEATRVWHRENLIPYDPRGDGEVYARFPSSYRSVATTQNDHQMHFPQTSTWIVGKGPYHEYGHIIHMRAWNGTTGACGDCPGGIYARDGDSTWSAISREYPNSAFAEGWANFVSHVIQNFPDQACASIDDNGISGGELCNADPDQYPDDTSNPVTYPNDGKSYARNVTKLLCDWYDGTGNGDNDSNMAGSGDHFAASLWSVWYNLDRMWSWTGGDSGLQVCDYIEYYLDERKSAAKVGQATHDDYVDLITDLSYNNGLKCGLDKP